MQSTRCVFIMFMSLASVLTMARNGFKVNEYRIILYDRSR